MDQVTHLQIEPTTRCNFTCGFCCGRYMEQSDLSIETFEKTLQAFPHLQHVELQGEGESLMHGRFFDMVARLRERGIRISLITNGSYLSRAVAEKIVDAPIEKISISMESADAATFQRIRGGKLDKVVRGMTTLLAVRRERGSARPAVGLSVTVLRGTQGHLQGIIALYRQLGLDGGLTLQPLQTMAPYVRNYAPAMQAQVLSDAEVEDLWVCFHADPDIKKIRRERGPVRGFFDEIMDGWKAGRRSCPWLEKAVYVNNKGQASACCMIKDTARFALGNVAEDRPERILAARAALRRELADGRVPAPCEGCELARFALMSKVELLSFGVRGMWRRWRGRRPSAPLPVDDLEPQGPRLHGLRLGPPTRVEHHEDDEHREEDGA